MILQVMALYDSKARAYRTPFCVAHVDVGIRAVKTAVNTAGHELSQFAPDFFLHHLGEFNDENAQFILAHSPINLGTIANLKTPERVVEKTIDVPAAYGPLNKE